MNAPADDPQSQVRLAAFLQGMQESGWAVGRNLQVDTRWGAGDAGRLRKYAAELVALAPDVILAGVGATTRSLQGASRTVPIVFAESIDPVGAGFVASLARPGGNTTGFAQFEYSLSGKWLELLKEIAPGVTRAAVLRDSAFPAGIGQWAVIQAAASSLRVDLSPVDVRDPGEIGRDVGAIAREPNGGLITAAGSAVTIHRELIVTLAARHRLRRPHPEGRAAGRPACAGTDQVRDSDQPQDREGARPGGASNAARPGRRGDRVRR